MQESSHIEVTATAWGKFSPLAPTVHTLVLQTPLCVAHGFFTFLTDEELEADSLRFLCSKGSKSDLLMASDHQAKKSPNSMGYKY